MDEMRFPEGFKWGSATSAHQIEGDNHNDWSEWEKSRPPEFRSGKACDSYNRYEEDFDIAKSLNQNIHRFSIEWSRIEPKEGKFDHEAMHHYVNVVKALRERGIEPMVTLWHFTNPIWFAEKGGWLNDKSPEIFTRYIKYVVDNLKDRVGLWITFNEAASIYAWFSYVNGQWPPQHRNIFEYIKVRKNFIKAQALAYWEIKRIYDIPQTLSDLDNHVSHNSFSTASPMSQKIQTLYDTADNVAQCQVGLVENNVYIPDTKSFVGTYIRRFYKKLWNFYFFDKSTPYYDFIGLNYYHMNRKPSFGENSEIIPKQEFMEEMNWEVYPKGIYHCLMELKKFKKPIFVTENGIADSMDLKRDKFIKNHLRWVWQAIHDGIDVRGYLYWSLLDNFEWAKGFKPRFGLVEVNYETFERKVRPSALEYAKICLGNKLEISN